MTMAGSLSLDDINDLVLGHVDPDKYFYDLEYYRDVRMLVDIIMVMSAEMWHHGIPVATQVNIIHDAMARVAAEEASNEATTRVMAENAVNVGRMLQRAFQ